VSPAKDQIKQYIGEFLASHGIMTLATADGGRPWVTTLYYGLDSDLNFFVLTDPASLHGQAFLKNPRVAFNIYDSHQKNSDAVKIGVQGIGTISLVTGLTANTKALLLWHKANPGMEARIGIKDLLKRVTDTKIYKITPDFLKHFNKSLYPGTSYGELPLS
jgi:uncharacterized protein YhbP (UPF0306 family)